MSQLHLRLDLPCPEVRLWDQFEAIHQQIVIEMLARLLLQAARPGAEEHAAAKAEEHADD